MHRRHPWIFSGAIRFKEDLRDGEIVQIFSSKDVYLATGYYQQGSIAIRILTYLEQEIDLKFWTDKITHALSLRKSWVCGRINLQIA